MKFELNFEIDAAGGVHRGGVEQWMVANVSFTGTETELQHSLKAGLFADSVKQALVCRSPWADEGCTRKEWDGGEQDFFTVEEYEQFKEESAWYGALVVPVCEGDKRFRYVVCSKTEHVEDQIEIHDLDVLDLLVNSCGPEQWTRTLADPLKWSTSVEVSRVGYCE